MPGSEEKTDTLSILVVGHQVPIYIMVYEAPQLVCSRGMAGRTCEAAEALVINNSAALAFCSAPPTVRPSGAERLLDVDRLSLI
jgi:hypothetical protein